MKEIKNVVLPVEQSKPVEPVAESKSKYIVMRINEYPAIRSDVSKKHIKDIFSELPGGLDCSSIDSSQSLQREIKEEMLVSRVKMHDDWEDKIHEPSMFMSPMERRQTTDGKTVWAKEGESQESVDKRGEPSTIPKDFVFPQIGPTLPKPVEAPQSVIENIMNARKGTPEDSSKKLKS